MESEERKKLTKVSNYKISQPHCITDAVERQERECKMVTCWDCIFKQTDEYDGTVFCVENGLRIISDIQCYGNAKPCEKLILRRRKI